MNESLLYLFGAILIVAALLLAVTTLSKSGAKKLNVEQYRSRWLKIERQLKKDDPASYHLAILNADKLLDLALKESGIKGETMGERLKLAKDVSSNRNAIWSAHKLRNQIAHETDVVVSFDQARRSLASFKRALKDLGAI